MSPKDNDDKRVILSKSDNVETIINDKVDEVIQKFSTISF